jgi:hypothetical protein
VRCGGRGESCLCCQAPALAPQTPLPSPHPVYTAGSYCPIGSPAPLPCADNTYSTGGAFQCSVCPSAPIAAAVNAHAALEADPLHPSPEPVVRCKTARLCCNM